MKRREQKGKSKRATGRERREDKHITGPSASRPSQPKSKRPKAQDARDGRACWLRTRTHTQTHRKKPETQLREKEERERKEKSSHKPIDCKERQDQKANGPHLRGLAQRQQPCDSSGTLAGPEPASGRRLPGSP